MKISCQKWEAFFRLKLKSETSSHGLSWELTPRNSEERGLGDAVRAYVVSPKATPNEEIIISKYIHYGMVVSPLCEGSLKVVVHVGEERKHVLFQGFVL